MATNRNLDPDRVRALLIESGGRVSGVARTLGVSHTTIFYWREKLGIAKGDRGRKAHPDRVRELHSQKLSDADIAVHLNCTETAVKNCRRKLGLKTHGKQSVSFIEKASASYRRRTAAMGITTLRQLNPGKRERETAELAAQYGLPTDLLRVQIRLVLELVSGPRTAGELADAVGRTMMRAQKNPYHRLNHRVVQGGNYLTNLLRRGLIAWVDQGKTRVYMLSPLAMEMLATVKEANHVV